MEQARDRQRARLEVRGRNKPAGQVTRGKTVQNRLRRVDTYLLLAERYLLGRRDGLYDRALFVDVGYGAEPFTTLESAERLRRVNPVLPVLGVEIDAERVAAAMPYADHHTHFRLGGFNLPLQPGEHVRLIRAFNVLRQYEEDAVAEAWRLMGQHLLPGGLLIEGTSDPFGQVWVANLVRKQESGELAQEGLLFSTNFRQGFAPEQFQPVLPKNFIHRVIPGEPIELFFRQWQQAYRETLPYRNWGVRQHFVQTARRLGEMGVKVGLRPRFLNQGFLPFMVWE
ncbi:MAG: methylase [Chloroflexi bacterium]|nr:methylase [Chloroflexota bacterium]